MRSKQRYQSFVRTLAPNSPAGLDNGRSLDIDSSYSRITGIWIKVISKGGLKEVDISLQDNDRTYLNSTDSEVAQADASVPPNHKFLTTDIPVKNGQGLKLPVKTSAVNVSELKLKVTFRLDKS